MACCASCKISGMGKKKNKVSGLGKADAGEIAALVIGAPVGALATDLGKEYLMPMITEGKTADEVITYSRIANGVIGVAGLGAAVGGLMLRKKSPAMGMGLLSFGLGVATQVMLSVYVNDLKDQTKSPKLSGKGWTAKAWSDERRKMLGIKGGDNNAPGLAGADNDAPGLAGLKLPKPFLTNVDQVGRRYRMSGCGL